MLLALAALALSCRGESGVRSRLQSSNRSQLRSEAAQLQQRYVVRDRSAREVPRGEWPKAFIAFDPERVWVNEFGVYICTYAAFVEHAGLFIRTDSSYEPPSSGDPGFKQIDSDFFWYYAPG